MRVSAALLLVTGSIGFLMWFLVMIVWMFNPKFNFDGGAAGTVCFASVSMLIAGVVLVAEPWKDKS